MFISYAPPTSVSLFCFYYSIYHNTCIPLPSFEQKRFARVTSASQGGWASVGEARPNHTHAGTMERRPKTIVLRTRQLYCAASGIGLESKEKIGDQSMRFDSRGRVQ